MRKHVKISIVGSAIILLLAKCKQEYVPNVEQKNVKLLVVEGFINSGQDSTTFRLSRTSNLQDTTISPEEGALVQVEGDDGSSFHLFENLQGHYSISHLTLNSNAMYRLYIRTNDGTEYTSDFVPVKHTPDIDSISWQRENEGVQIYVSSHNDQNNTKYYRWTYTETWEFHSTYLSYLDYDIDPISHDLRGLKGRSNTDSIYKCWKTQNSTNIIVGSSEKLTVDKIFLPIRYIPPLGEELSVRYYIELKQYAIGKEAYLFYQQLKKNTEQLGSIFDPLPSGTAGNIHCLSDAAQPVIGYVEVSEEKKATRFIAHSEVAPWTPPINCLTKILFNDPDSFRSYVTDYIPLKGVTFRGLTIVTFSAAPSWCVDCTLRGSNIKPSFWP